MTDPYNNNPFATDDGEIKNETDANRELAREKHAKRIRVELRELFREIALTHMRINNAE